MWSNQLLQVALSQLAGRTRGGAWSCAMLCKRPLTSAAVLPCQSNTVLTAQPLTVQKGTLKLPNTNTVWHILQCHYVGGFGSLVTAVQTAIQDGPYTTPLDQTPQYVAAASAVFEPASAVLGAAAAGDPQRIGGCTSCCCHGCLRCCRLLRLRTHNRQPDSTQHIESVLQSMY